jgi:predicted RNA-binding protein
MLRHSIAASVLLLVFACGVLAADKEVKGTVIKVDLDKKTLTVKTEDGEKTYDINDDTKFLGPKDGVSKDGIKDDRLAKGAEVKLVIAGNNKTAREVHLPERKGKDKDK